MRTVEVFYLDESSYYPGKYTIRVHHDKFFCTYTEGSYALLPARILGLNYAWYLRMCRDELKAEIYGKNKKYPVAYFGEKLLANRLIKLLNSCASTILWERDHLAEEPKMIKAVQEADKRNKEIREKYDNNHNSNA